VSCVCVCPPCFLFHNNGYSTFMVWIVCSSVPGFTTSIPVTPSNTPTNSVTPSITPTISPTPSITPSTSMSPVPLIGTELCGDWELDPAGKACSLPPRVCLFSCLYLIYSMNVCPFYVLSFCLSLSHIHDLNLLETLTMQMSTTMTAKP